MTLALPPPVPASLHTDMPDDAPEPEPAAMAPAAAKKRPPYVFLAVTAAATLAADALTKLAVVNALDGPDGPTQISVLDGNFEITLRRNTGGAWSLLHDAPDWVRRPFFVLVSVAAVLFIVMAYRKLGERRAAGRWGFALVLGGALGNLVDRIRDSAVVDFVHWHAQWGGADHEWPTFNVADVAIVLGVVLLFVDGIMNRKRARAA